MFDKRCCQLIIILIFLVFGSLSIWRPIGSPGPPNLSLESHNYLPLVPSNASDVPYQVDSLPAEDLNALIDLRNFNFITNQPLVSCYNSTPFIVALVITTPANSYNRQLIRETWGSRLKTVFFVGEVNSTSLKENIDKEMMIYKDIVQGSFLDSYRNLTYKHVMGLKWATYHCPGAKYILKSDDDVFINTPFLHQFLINQVSPLGARKLLLCDVKKSMLVKRTYRDKWRVAPAEYPGRWYPQYCPGWALVYSPDVVFKLYSEAQNSPYFWIDDVQITGILASKINLTQTSVTPFVILETETENLVKSGITKTDFLFSLTDPKYFKYLWRMVDDTNSYNVYNSKFES